MFPVVFIFAGTFFCSSLEKAQKLEPAKISATQYFLKRLKNCCLPEWHALAWIKS